MSGTYVGLKKTTTTTKTERQYFENKRDGIMYKEPN
jgi:hypothetical protein